MNDSLIIVESPAKARTISGFLGRGYTVMASMGHIRDLPPNRLGYDAKNNFKPEYVVDPKKKKLVWELKKNIGSETTIYLAADEDREGEAIAWHLIPTLGIKNNPIERIVFHEITKEAILKAIENPIKLNQNLVDAQQARRILDRAVGYELSPLLWKKVKYGLSAGRVQSVALRIIVDREKEIEEFNPEEYWKLKADFINPNFKADLTKVDGKTAKFNTFEDVDKIKEDLETSDYILTDIVEKESKRFPSPPFITSTLQQESNNKLHMSVKQTMNVAQQLYEGNVGSIPNHKGGLITYMRTDSLSLSNVATTAAKEFIVANYGKQYSLGYVNVFKSKSKGAQEAHEAIRPVNLKLTPEMIQPYVDKYQFKLYQLIWRRTIATQMAFAKVANSTFKITAGKNKNFEFTAKGTRIVFDGFLKVYGDGGGDDKILPSIPVGSKLNFDKLLCEQNWTKPPARYSEAAMVKKLDAEGIGRPSTYANTIGTIITRTYVVVNEENKLQATEVGKTVNQFMMDNFPDIVNLKFTANIENEFDKIARGEVVWTKVLHDFYGDFSATIKEKEKTLEKGTYRLGRDLGIDPVSKLTIAIGTGKYGSYVKMYDPENKEVKPKFGNIPGNINKENITLETAMDFFRLPRELGMSGKNPVVINTGRFGPYIKIGKKYYNFKEEDPYTISLEEALKIAKTADDMKAKAIIHTWPDVKIQVLKGQYGPYIKQDKSNYKIPKGTEPTTLTKEAVLGIIKNASKAGKKTFRKFKRR